jgi:hypothetical protein
MHLYSIGLCLESAYVACIFVWWIVLFVSLLYGFGIEPDRFGTPCQNNC